MGLTSHCFIWFSGPGGYESWTTPLHEACSRGHDKCAELLLRHRANPADPNARGMSFSARRVPIVAFDAKIDVDVLPDSEGWTPLHSAYSSSTYGKEDGYHRCIKVLLENGADEKIRGMYSFCIGHFGCFSVHLPSHKIKKVTVHDIISSMTFLLLLKLHFDQKSEHFRPFPFPQNLTWLSVTKFTYVIA